jgi:dihydroorotase
MQDCGLTLNLHSEHPTPSVNPDITVFDAESRFPPTLLDLHLWFKGLGIVLEHCTIAITIRAIKSCGPNVVGSFSAHHSFLIMDNVVGEPFHLCKPVPKFLVGEEEHFFRATASSSDSAPQSKLAKKVEESRQNKYLCTAKC